MADTKISDLTGKTTPIAADTSVIVDSVGGANKSILLGNLPLTGNRELKALATGLLKNTTTTGTPSIAVSGTDYSGGTAALATGILKSTTTTGSLSIATAGSDYLAPIDPSPDADHGYSGTVISGTAGEALAINNLVYLKSDGLFWKAQANAEATMSAVGIATAAADAAASIVVLLWGFIRNDDGWGGPMTIGSHGAGRIWVSAATAGLATQTAPGSGNFAQCVGYAVAARIAFFDFNRTYVEVA